MRSCQLRFADGFFRDPSHLFQLRSPELAEDFERLMIGDRDIVRGSLVWDCLEYLVSGQGMLVLCSVL